LDPECRPAIFRKRWFLEASQLSEQIIGCLLAMVVDAMSGMVTQVRPPRRDEMNAYYRASRRSAIRANCHRIVTRETPTHEYATIATWSGAD
jgi:hypothetical protein